MLGIEMSCFFCRVKSLLIGRECLFEVDGEVMVASALTKGGGMTQRRLRLIKVY